MTRLQLVRTMKSRFQAQIVANPNDEDLWLLMLKWLLDHLNQLGD